MKLAALAVLSLALLAPAVRAADYAAPGRHDVAVTTFDWNDAKRDRDVPVKIYAPKDLATLPDKSPVIIFSHGLGGSRDGYSFLGKHWASHGFVSIHLTHKGSDTAAVVATGRNDPLGAARDAANAKNSILRVQDVSFAIDQATTLNKENGAFKDKLDLAHVGMAGHSFGGNTTMRVIGQQSATAFGQNFFKDAPPDPRVKAAIAMSAPAARGKDLDAAYSHITTPVLCMTGTLDDSPIGGTLAPDRRAPFDHMTAAERYLVIFEGGDHMIFSGKRAPGRAGKLPGTKGDASKDERFHTLILASTTAFWQAHLRGDATAKTYLAEPEGFAKELAKDGSWDHKAASSKP